MTDFDRIRELIDDVEREAEDMATTKSELRDRVNELEAEVADLQNTIDTLEGELFGEKA